MDESKSDNQHLVPRLPTELWQMITFQLSSLSAKHFADEFRTGFFRSSQRKHGQLWNRIFKDEMWLCTAEKLQCNPILIGRDLPKLYYQNDQSGYLVLLGNDIHSGDLCFQHEQLFKSLKRHDYNKDTTEIIFEDGLILNIYDLFIREYDIVVIDLKRLFSYQNKKLRSFYLFWKDAEFSLHHLTPRDVRVGPRRTRVSTIKDVFQDFCRLTLTDPHGKCEEYCVDDNEIFIRKGERYIRFPHIGDGKPQVANEIGATYSTAAARKLIQQSIQ